MKASYDLSELGWKLSGWTPFLCRLQHTLEIGATPDAEIPSLPAKVPGSVQYTLREAGLIPDWNMGNNYRDCEWVENRHWVYETILPDDWFKSDKTYRLHCEGLDYCGVVYLNGQPVGEFCGSHVPHAFNLTPHLQESGNMLRILFDLPPRWLGQFGYTSRMTEWKTRFNYTWDWTPRLVQVGIWNSIRIEETDGFEIESMRCYTDVESDLGVLKLWGKFAGPDNARVHVSLSKDGITLRKQVLSAAEFAEGMEWPDLSVELWYPNLIGDQPLYDLHIHLVDEGGGEVDQHTRRVGFKRIVWEPCEGAPEGAMNWLCNVNGRRIFLQGINWVPILPNYADVTEDMYRKRLELYKDLGLNILRVWGGAVLERECFYDMCDELGLMVWQEFPQSSSGICNWPSEDQQAIDEMAAIAESYIARRQHHVSLLLWCGGNELQGAEDGGKQGCGKPCTLEHPMLSRLDRVVKKEDPTRRFLPCSPYGPYFYASPDRFGQGVHWHVHGPWKPDGDLSHWARFWSGDDSHFRSETGSPGTSSADLIRQYAGSCDPFPATYSNPLWRRTSTWWIEWDQFMAEHGREPKDLDEYCEWSQERQKQALYVAIKSCKDRFPNCGGFIIWMGHDCFPCTANTSIVDFHGEPKPAALALREIWHTPVER